jgi:hypothetical protein
VPSCVVCDKAGSDRRRLLVCTGCRCFTHSTCLGLGPFAFPGGFFECASCVLLSACLEAPGLDPTGPPAAAGRESATRLVWLRGSRTQLSSQATYASALHRFVYWAAAIMGLPLETALPPAAGAGVRKIHVELFISWAMTKYKFATVKSTVDALANWCRDKGAPLQDSVRHKDVGALLATAQATCGPEGLPKGKLGMSIPLLQTLISYLGAQKAKDPALAPIHTRDIAWLVLGFFGMLRRSELIGLTIGDVSLAGTGPGDGVITLWIARSKTDRAGQGALVPIAGASGQRWDLWSPVSRYLDLRRTAGAQPADPFLVQWDLDTRRLGREPIKTSQALAIRLQGMLTRLKQTYQDLELCPEAYGMHSLRRGGVMAAWAAGVEVALIKLHGRWRSDSGMRPYLTPDLRTQLRVTSRM